MRTSSTCLLLLLLLTDLGPEVAQAQQPAGGAGAGVILGIATSVQTGQPVAAATVSIRLMPDSTLVAGTITDNAGRFVREGLPFGVYRVEVGSVGHVAYVRGDVRLTVQAPRQDLGVIQMRSAVVEVQGVTAEGERAQVMVASDRSIYFVRDMPVVQSGFATDALRAIPELEVDIDDNIRARGGEPQIFLDGRPLPMQGPARIAFLRSLRADRIERIEYIANPSARYEAEGQGGIVNIVLRRDTSLGLSGSTAANAGTRGTQNLSTRLNYQQGRLTLFGGALLGFNQTRVSSFDLRQNRAANPITYLQQNAARERDGINGGGDLTAEYRLTPRSTSWAIVRTNLGTADESSLSEFIHLDAAQAATERYQRENLADNDSRSYSGALGYRRVVQAQRDELSAELRYNFNVSDAANENRRHLYSLDGIRLDLPPELTRVDTDNEDGLWAMQVDLSKPVGSAARIDIGYRGNFRVTWNEQDLSLLTGNQSTDRAERDDFRYAEDAHAMYANGDFRIGRWGFQAGLRAENVAGTVEASTLADPVRTDRTGMFPSTNIAHDFGGGRQVRLSYSKRIQRPVAAQLNPINTTPADPFNRSVGNPRLDPTGVHSASLDGSWSGGVGTLRLSSFLMQGSGFPDRIRSVDPAGVSTLTWESIGSATVAGLNLNGSVRQVGPLTGFLGVNLARIEYDAGSSNVGAGSFHIWGTNANVTALLSRTLRVQTTAAYSPGQLSTQSRSSGLRQINVGMTQRLMNDRGTLTLSLVDPFDLSRTTTTTRDASHEQTARTNNRIRRASLSFSYSFGRPPQSERRTVQDDPMGGGGMPLGAPAQ